MGLLKASCPFCGHGNEIDLDFYSSNQDHMIGLHDVCDHCNKIYGFDVELKYLTHTYDAKLNYPN